MPDNEEQKARRKERDSKPENKERKRLKAAEKNEIKSKAKHLENPDIRAKFLKDTSDYIDPHDNIDLFSSMIAHPRISERADISLFGSNLKKPSPVEDDEVRPNRSTTTGLTDRERQNSVVYREGAIFPNDEIYLGTTQTLWLVKRKNEKLVDISKLVVLEMKRVAFSNYFGLFNPDPANPYFYLAEMSRRHDCIIKDLDQENEIPRFQSLFRKDSPERENLVKQVSRFKSIVDIVDFEKNDALLSEALEVFTFGIVSNVYAEYLLKYLRLIIQLEESNNETKLIVHFIELAKKYPGVNSVNGPSYDARHKTLSEESENIYLASKTIGLVFHDHQVAAELCSLNLYFGIRMPSSPRRMDHDSELTCNIGMSISQADCHLAILDTRRQLTNGNIKSPLLRFIPPHLEYLDKQCKIPQVGGSGDIFVHYCTFEITLVEVAFSICRGRLSDSAFVGNSPISDRRSKAN